MTLRAPVSRGMGRLEDRLFGLLVRVYPATLRAQYGDELRQVLGEMRSAQSSRGLVGRAGLWLLLGSDAWRSAMAERSRLRGAERARPGVDADYRGAAVACLGVLLLYVVTLAPTTAFWDAGEYITVAAIAGIPHPPGNAWFVVMARAWDAVVSLAGWPTAVGMNLFSAVCSAAAHFFLYLCVERSLRGSGGDVAWRRIAAGAAVLLSATAFTVWHQSNVNEKVYTFSFATVMASAWLVLRWRDTRDVRLLLLAVYVTALSSVNHLMGVLIAPALVLFVVLVDWRVLAERRTCVVAVSAVLLALSAHLFLPLRAANQPLVNEGDPRCDSVGSALASIYSGGRAGCAALSFTLRREQYGKPSVLADPTDPVRPRGGALLTAQFVNYAQYLDWQWARSIAGSDPLFGGARPLVTMLVLLLVATGASTHWRSDRHGALLHGVSLFTFSVGLVLYLNFRYGYTIPREPVAGLALHEVRERDYFFLLGFSFWGAWLGVGVASLWRRAAERLAAHTSAARLVAAPLLMLALAPLALNWSWASRSDDWTARDWAYNVLMSVEPYGVLLTNGDNDSFPLWYLQHVERVREDVTVVLLPYLGTAWYAGQIRDISRPCGPGETPSSAPSRVVCQRSFRAERVHPRLLAAWGGAPAAPPEDSILPLSDAEIGSVAGNYWVPQEPVRLRFGGLESVVDAGTPLTPADTFVAAILRNAYGTRPIHFMAPSPVVARLGLLPHTVRTGLTWKLAALDSSPSTVAFAEPDRAPAMGAGIDLLVTDTLAEHVFVRRGRLLREDRPWVDHATYSIPTQYAIMHYAAAVAHEALQDDEAAARHVSALTFWGRLAGN